jgi:signal transduction histidine kinase
MFYILSIAASIWLAFLLISDISKDYTSALISLRLAIATSILCGFFFLLLCLDFPTERKSSYSKKLLLGTSLPVLGLVLLTILTPITVNQVVINSQGASPAGTTLFYTISTVVTVVYFVAGGIILYLRRKREKANLKYQIDLFVVAIVIVLLTNILAGYVLPLLGFGNIGASFGRLSFLAFGAITAYAIVRHGLFDVRLAVVRSVAYGLSLLTLALFYYAIAYLVSVTLFKGEATSSFSISPLNILLALALAFIFQPVKNFFDKVTNSIFYRDRYDAEDFFTRLNEMLGSSTDLRGLLQRAATEIAATLKAEQAFFYVQYNHVHHVCAGTSKSASLPSSDAHYLNEYVDQNGDEVLVRDLLASDHPLRRLMIGYKIAILVPLMKKKRVLGYLALGEQLSSGYTSRDIKTLGSVTDSLVIAVQNALSVQEVKDTNAHLQQKIDTATVELRTSNARLKRLDAAKDEFLSMASHQLRTPLTSVKGYLSMMIDGDVGKISATQRQVLEEAFSSSERMVHLIHDFLNVSRLQTGKFMLEFGDVNLAQLVAEEVKGLDRVAMSRSMKLDFINTAGDDILRLDDTKIRQVVMNYIDNAIYYSHPDTTITIELSKSADDIVLKVKDTGIGVPKAEQAHLFGKFYRATNARKQRPDGTGVGLYLAKKIITAHGGDVLFSSKPGKGSTFGFWLPLEDETK